MNNITQKQNTSQILNLLAAQRQLYSDAKKIQIISIIIGVPVAIILSVSAAVFPSLTGYIALLGIIAALLETLYLSRTRKSIQEKAAKIQQMFDCEVLVFDWSRLHCGNKIDQETILDARNRYKHNHLDFYEKLQNWYPVTVEQLPIHTARIVCQRSNVWWDSQLRRRYSRWMIIILVALISIAVLIGLLKDLSLEKFVLTFIFPLLPAFILGFSQYIEQNDAANKLDQLKDDAKSLFDKVNRGKYTVQELEEESYSLQTQIYDNRRSNPLIPEKFYLRLRNKNEELMNKNAESLVQELTQKP